MKRNKGTLCSKIHAKIGSHIYWIGLIRLYMELFFDLTLLSILNLHTVDWETQFTGVQISNILSVIILSLVCGLLVFYIVGYFY